MSEYFFTSESVSEGHPDKLADQVSDSILDAILEQDPTARVAAETLANTGLIVLAGEITTTANVDYIKVARDAIKRIGYDNTEYGIDYKGCAVLVAYDKQSPDIAQGVDGAHDDPLDQGAGDQGIMFGYACDETPQLMPLPIWLSHRIVERQSQLRKDGRLPWLRPDAKSQVTIKYENGKPSAIEGLLSRGDRRVGAVILRAWENGQRFDGWTEHFSYERWVAAADEIFAGSPLSLDWFTTRERDLSEALPWDHLDSGLDKEWLWSDWQEALAGGEVDDCRWTPCFDCGVCPTMDTEIQVGPTGRTIPLLVNR